MGFKENIMHGLGIRPKNYKYKTQTQYKDSNRDALNTDNTKPSKKQKTLGSESFSTLSHDNFRYLLRFLQRRLIVPQIHF